MALKGDLASVDLAQVFQMLALNQKVGMLSIQAPGTWNALYFDHRGVTLYFNEHLLLDKVLGNMVRTGQLQADAVRESREHAAGQGISVVDSLLAAGFVTEAELEAAFRHEMEEQVYDLFFWREAKFEFFEGATGFEGREGAINERFFFSTDSLIMEAARRIDEWAFIQERISGPEEIFRPIEDNPNILKLDDLTLSVLELVDGKRNVERLIEITGVSSFHVYKSLAQLLDEAMIEEVQSGQLVGAAKECVAEGRLQDAINLYERAISLNEGLPETHALVAHAYESTQEYELAAYHLKCVAEYYASGNDVVEAVDLLRHVMEMLPTDLATRERIVELTVGAPEFKNSAVNAVAEGKVLVDLYLEIDEIDRVRTILERLLRDNPDDIELKKSLINVHTKASDTRRVIELYESIADDLVRKGDPIEAVKYLQKILMIDRSRKDVSERIRSLYELDERRRSRRRSMAALGALLCIVAALACVWYFYEQYARERFEKLDVEQLLAGKDFEAAIGVYETFLASYPWTLVAKDARAALTRIESMRLAHDARIKREQALEDANRNRIRTRYRLAWDRYLTEWNAQNLSAALDQLETCRKLVAEVGQEWDQKWAEKVQLEKQVGELRRYIGDAAALERVARDLLAAGEWQQAREKLLELTSRYELTEVAKRVRIPVMVTSRPPGAKILKGDQVLTRSEGGTEVELTTPAIVYCHQKYVEELTLHRDGFERLPITIHARQAAVSHHVLTVVPDSVIDFAAPVQTTPAVGQGMIIVGLRGGRIGLARADGSAQLPPIQLHELREVVGVPAIADNVFFFRTNEAELACRLLSGANAYSVALESPPATDPVVAGNRVIISDQSNRVICLETGTGAVLWRFEGMPGPIAGRPAVHGRHARFTTTAGDYVILDIVNGSVTKHHAGLPGFSSAPLLIHGAAVVGAADGRLIALSEKTGKVVWTANVGRAVRDGDAILTDSSVVAVGGAGNLLKLGLQDGVQEATFELPGRPLSGPVRLGERIYVTVRERVDAKTQRDLLVALELATFEVAWEFRDGGTFRGALASDDTAVYLPDSTTKVLRFQ